MPDRTLLTGGKLDIKLLRDLAQQPDPFTPGDSLFWVDPYVSQQVLEAHLDPDTDAASRPPHIIEKSVGWLTRFLKLQPGEQVLDLGCGPGLYATELALKGFEVTGIDISRTAIKHARQEAHNKDLSITYLCQDFLELAFRSQFNVVMQIYGEICTLSPRDRDNLLSGVYRALKTGGHFVFDVSTPEKHRPDAGQKDWYASDGGFWRPGPHVVLVQHIAYPDDNIFLDQYHVIEPDGTTAIYRNWFNDYTPETITPILEEAGFTVESIWSDLQGTPYRANSEWLGVVAKKL
ncbi:MAG: class I SAM-dependent methyltransferase [Anaerolineae bacterium]|nr:class I SAM-dependent methyltransferase [Anaerolineae bacterium]